MSQIGVRSVLKNAFEVFFQNFGIVLFIAVVTGGVGSAVSTVAATAFADAVDMKGQQLLVVTQLFSVLVLTVWSGFVGSWAAPAQIYLWVQREKGKPASLYEAINFGLNRFRRVFAAHFKAYAIIAAGNIVIVPGVLFGLMFAFVDAIATLDVQEQSPLARSQRLTSGRRGTIFRTMAVFLVWWIPYQLLIVFLAQSTNLLYASLSGIVDHMVLILIDLCMVQIYLDLFRKKHAPVEPPPVEQAGTADPAAGAYAPLPIKGSDETVG